MQIKNMWSGAFFSLIGCFFIYHNEYDYGDFSSIGPGYFPELISWLLILIGVSLIVKSAIWKS